MRVRLCLRLFPVRICHRLRRRAAEVGVREDHAAEELLHDLGHLPGADPLAAEGTGPVLLQILLGGELLTLGVLEWRTTDQDLKKCDAERPYVRLARVVRETSCALWREILRATMVRRPIKEEERGAYNESQGR